MDLVDPGKCPSVVLGDAGTIELKEKAFTTLGIFELVLADKVGTQILRGQEVDEDPSSSASPQGVDGVTPLGIEEVADENGGVGALVFSAGAPQRVSELRHPTGLKLPYRAQELPCVPAPSPNRRPPPELCRRSGETGTISAGEGYVAESGSELFGVRHLTRLAHLHAGTAVEQDVYGLILFLDEHFYKEPVEARIDIPVDMTKIVAGTVLAVIAKLYTVASLSAPTIPLVAGKPDRRQPETESR